MRLRPFAPLSALVLLAATFSGGCLRPEPRPAAVPSTNGAGVDDVVRATLDDGLRVVIVRNTLAPMVATQLSYRVGGYETPSGFPGTAHALEHMLFRDSEGLSGAQLDEITGKLGGDANAFTTNDLTQFTFSVPAQYLDLVLRIESIRMRGAKLSAPDWRLEKGAIEQEVSRDISDPGFLAFQQAEKILYAGTGYAEDPLGTRPSFGQTTAKALRDFYDTWYQPNNAILVIAGDVDPRAALAEVKSLFSAIPARPVPPRAPLELRPVAAQTISRATPASTGSVQFLHRFPGMRSPDYAAAQVLVDVLNDPLSRISELAAQGRVLSADADVQPFTEGGIGLVEVGFPDGGDAKQAEADLAGALDAIRKHGVPAELVAAAKRSELAQLEFSKNSAVTHASEWSLALAWQGLDSPEEAAQRIEQVRVEDVNRVARRTLAPEGRVTIVLSPSRDGERPPDSAGFGGSESFAGSAALDVPLPSWANDALGKLELPHWTLAPSRFTLANGIDLIVQPEHVSRTVTVVGRVDHDAGMQEPAGQEGIGRLLSTLFDYGTTTLDRTAFHRALDDIAASETAGEDFELAVPSAGFERGLELLADNELHPVFPAEAFTAQRTLLAARIAGELKSPGYRMIRALRKGLLPAGDPHLREATAATVGGLTRADLDAYFAAAFRPDLTTIVVVGDVTPEQAKASVEKVFGAWTATGPKPDVIPPTVPLNPPGYTVVPNAYASQDRVILAQVLGLTLKDPDRYALTLGNDVLGGAGFASRLMADIRVAHGYAYSVASTTHFDRSRSVFTVDYGSDPGKVGLVDARVRANLDAMRESPVDEASLTNARQLEIRSIALDVGSVDRIGRSLLTWGQDGEPLDQPMVAARHYLALTAAQVRDAFRRYLDPDHLVEVVQGPAPPQH